MIGLIECGLIGGLLTLLSQYLMDWNQMGKGTLYADLILEGSLNLEERTDLKLPQFKREP